MKTKVLSLVLFAVLNVSAISSYSPYKVYQQYDTLTHANLDSNLLRGSNWSALLVDTLENKFIRFTDVKDSTFQKIKADSIRSNPDIDSIKGNPYIDTVTTDHISSVTGTYSGAISSTTINTGNGAVECYAQDQNTRTTDAVTFSTVNTGQGANELYDMDQNVLTTSDVTFDSAYFTSGIRGVRLTMDSVYSTAGRFARLYATKATVDSFVNNVVAYNATEYGSYIGIFKGQGYLPGYPNNYYPVLKTDNNSLFLAANNKYVGYLGNGSSNNYFNLSNNANTATNVSINSDAASYFNGGNVGINTTTPSTTLDVVGSVAISGACTTGTINTGHGDFEIGQSVLTSSAVTFSTVNTGQGANELYDMDQNVQTTDDVTFDSVRVTDDVVIDDTLKVGTTASGQVKIFDGWYRDTTFVCSVYTENNATLLGTSTVDATKIGDQVTLAFGYVSGTAVTGSGAFVCRNIPTWLRSSNTEQAIAIPIYENSAWSLGILVVSSSSPYFYISTGSYGPVASGTARTRGVATYLLN